MRTGKKIELWERAFIQLSFIDFSNGEIANYLERTKGAIQIYLSENKLKRNIKIKKIQEKDTFGYLTVIEESKTRKNRQKCYYCICICGQVLEVRRTSLLDENTRSCGCLHKEIIANKRIVTRYVTPKYFIGIKSGAVRRNLEFDINIYFIEKLLENQNFKCAISGILLKMERFDGDWNAENTASLDRIDNNKGYTQDNIQWVHKDINKMKMNFDQKTFIEYCKQIARNNP